jgi:hypothetical protein
MVGRKGKGGLRERREEDEGSKTKTNSPPKKISGGTASIFLSFFKRQNVHSNNSFN